MRLRGWEKRVGGRCDVVKKGQLEDSSKEYGGSGTYKSPAGAEEG